MAKDKIVINFENEKLTSVVIDNPAHIDIRVADVRTRVLLDRELYATFREKWVRSNPSQIQKGDYYAVLNLMAAAYLQGHNDAARATVDHTPEIGA